MTVAPTATGSIGVQAGVLAVLFFSGCATSSGEERPAASGEQRAGATTSEIPGVPAGISFGGGNGLSCERRVIVQGTTNEMAGVSAEYAWLRAKYPGFKRGPQSLMKCDGKPADKLSIRTASGKALDVYFDISAFFGKGFGE
jgi:hypothetical protein